MKKIIYIILSVFLITSCTNNKKTIDKSEATKDDKRNQIEKLKQKFLPILQGVWVNTDYINEVEKTKSPLKSAYKLEGVAAMVIEGAIQGDSIDVGWSLNNHEGSGFTVYFVNGQSNNSLKTNLPDYVVKSNYYDLGYEIINNEPFLFLYHYNKTNKLIDKKKFSKIANENQDNDMGWGIQYIVNETLFTGSYLLIDSTNSVTKINLKSDGSLNGYPKYKYYYVFTDFGGGPEIGLDLICLNFNSRRGEGKCFAFKIESDTTYLYSTIGDEEAGETIQLDKIKYKLVRK